MAERGVTTDEVLDRLEILWRKLEDEGMYVRANTVALAIDEIKRLSNDQPSIPLHTPATRPNPG